MFGFGWTEIVVLLVIGLFVFGPERLPSVLSEGFGMLRQLRTMARQVTDDIKTELGPEFADIDLASLTPRALVDKHLLGDDDGEPSPQASTGARTAVSSPKVSAPAAPRVAVLRAGEIPPWDPDAT